MLSVELLPSQDYLVVIVGLESSVALVKQIGSQRPFPFHLQQNSQRVPDFIEVGQQRCPFGPPDPVLLQAWIYPGTSFFQHQSCQFSFGCRDSSKLLPLRELLEPGEAIVYHTNFQYWEIMLFRNSTALWFPWLEKDYINPKLFICLRPFFFNQSSQHAYVVLARHCSEACRAISLQLSLCKQVNGHRQLPEAMRVRAQQSWAFISDHLPYCL